MYVVTVPVHFSSVGPSKAGYLLVLPGPIKAGELETFITITWTQ